jgi:hypothetical protein
VLKEDNFLLLGGKSKHLFAPQQTKIEQGRG